jgi:hypothetical protein
MRILAILAHPDDEILWSFPILQDKGYEVAIVTLCCNAHKGIGALLSLQDVCRGNSVSFMGCPLQDNQFYRLPTRKAPFTLMRALELIRGNIDWAISEFQPEAIFTHNPWGEYGHGDHRLCFDVATRTNLPLILTDICIENKCHPSCNEMPLFWGQVFTPDKLLRSCTLDEVWYDQMKKIYESRNAWTWGGHEPVRETNLYLFGKGA